VKVEGGFMRLGGDKRVGEGMEVGGNGLGGTGNTGIREENRNLGKWARTRRIKWLWGDGRVL
jgi:hypothetical protein